MKPIYNELTQIKFKCSIWHLGTPKSRLLSPLLFLSYCSFQDIRLRTWTSSACNYNKPNTAPGVSWNVCIAINWPSHVPRDGQLNWNFLHQKLTAIHHVVRQSILCNCTLWNCRWSRRYAYPWYLASSDKLGELLIATRPSTFRICPLLSPAAAADGREETTTERHFEVRKSQSKYSPEVSSVRVAVEHL